MRQLAWDPSLRHLDHRHHCHTLTLPGYTFRATPLNVLFQPVQPQVTELADRLLPQITTVEIGPDVLGGSDLMAWRQVSQLVR